MRLLTGKQAEQFVPGVLSARHQVHGTSVDLTAARIYNLGATGAVDFGGSELLPADPMPQPSYQKHSQDRYEWWSLKRGAYLVECNESLRLGPDEIALNEPHERLLKAGATHATRFLRGTMDPVYLILDVMTGKVEIKQNSRISLIRVFVLEGGTPSRPAAGKSKTSSRKKPVNRAAGKKKKRR